MNQIRWKRKITYFLTIFFCFLILFVEGIQAQNFFLFEAEDYDLNPDPPTATFIPLEVRDDPDASGGKYIVFWDGGKPADEDYTPGQAHYSFTLTSTKNVVIWARVDFRSTSHDSWYHKIDGFFGWTRDNIKDKTSGWEWKNVKNVGDMPAATYTYKLLYREDESKVDRIYISLDGTAPSVIPPRIPDIPANLTAGLDPLDYETIMLSWSDVNYETSYILRRNVNNNDINSASNIAVLPANQTTYLDAGLPLDPTYYYWVKATNMLGASNFSAYASKRIAWTFVPNAPNPLLTDGYNVEENVPISWGNVANETSYTLFWSTNINIKTNAVTNRINFLYIVTTNGTTNTNAVTNFANFGKNQTTYTDKNSVMGKTNYYWVRAYNKNGSSGISSVAKAILPPPDTPQFTINYFSGADLILEWSDVANETSYTLFRSTNNNSGLATNIAGFPANQLVYTDTNSIVVKTNYYWVKAYNKAGPSGFSSVLPTKLTAPDTPTGITASLPDVDIIISWNDVQTETSYTLYRSTDNITNSFSWKTNVPMNTTFFIDRNFDVNVNNYYWVKAFNPVGESRYSSPAFNRLDPPNIPAPLTAVYKVYENEDVELSWQNVSRETTYTLFRSTNKNFIDIGITNIITLPADMITYTDPNSILGKTNYYWIEAFNRAGGSATASASALLTEPDIPTGLTTELIRTPGFFHVILSWNDLVDQETSYTLFRNLLNDTNLALPLPAIMTKNLTVYTDKFLTLNDINYYWVQAYNGVGNSGFSSYISITVPPEYPPPFPYYLNAYPLDLSSIHLQWPYVDTADGYWIYRNTSYNLDTAEKITALAANVTSYTDMKLDSRKRLNPGTTYHYWVIATNLGGSYRDIYAFATTFSSIGLKVRAQSFAGGKDVALTWNPPANVQRYKVYRSFTPIEDLNSGSLIANLPALDAEGEDTYRYFDESVEYNKTYFYNIAYTIDNVVYTLDSPAGDFIAVVIRADDFKFAHGIELEQRYDKLISQAIKNPGTTYPIANHPVIIGDLIAAYEFVIYKIGNLPVRTNISSTHKLENGKLEYLLDGIIDPDYYIEGDGDSGFDDRVRWKDSDPTVTIDFGTVVYIDKLKIYSVYRKDKWLSLTVSLKAFDIETTVTNVRDSYNSPDHKELTITNLGNARSVMINIANERDKIRLDEIEVYWRRYKEKYTEELDLQNKISLVLPYNDFDNDGYPEKYNSIEPISSKEDKLGVFYLAGNEWIYLGGEVNTTANIISFDSQNLGIFAIFPVDRSKLTDDPVVLSQRYITADGDGINDCLTFTINPKNKKVKLDINIYDLSGKIIVRLARSQTINDIYTRDWCGKTQQGQEVEIGPYLYEVRFDDKKVENGVILIVK